MTGAMSNESAQAKLLPLEGRRVLVVEDEYYIADELRGILHSIGAKVIGPVGTLDAAARALDEGAFDCAVVDLNLHGDSAVPIADRLVDIGTPFVIATGYGSAAVPDRLRQVPRIEKPYDAAGFSQLASKLCGTHCQ